MQPETRALLEQHAPDETVIDSGAARAKKFDKVALETYLATFGRPRGGLNFLEADWVATDKALYYISPRAQWRWMTEWDEIESVTMGRRSLFLPTQQVVIRAHDTDIDPSGPETHSWKLSKVAATSLVAIAADRINSAR